MQIVIDIPEETQVACLQWDDMEFSYKALCTAIMVTAIRHGTVLPKHGRLIEVTDELDYQLSTYERWTGIDELPYEYAVMEIRNAPTILEAWGNEE